MTHEQKTDYLFWTLALGLKYYREEPAVWMTDSGADIEKTVESALVATDLSAKMRLNDATFGRGVKIATFDTVKQLLRAVKSGKVMGPKLTGNEWLSWPLERKQALVARYLTIAFMGIGIEKQWHAEDVALGYIEAIDTGAEKHRDDPRLNKFIANFLNGFLRGAVEDFKRQQAAK